MSPEFYSFIFVGSRLNSALNLEKLQLLLKDFMLLFLSLLVHLNKFTLVFYVLQSSPNYIIIRCLTLSLQQKRFFTVQEHLQPRQIQ